MSTETRWAVLGTGGIATAFVTCAPHAASTRVTAVISRTQASARDFAERFAIPHASDDLAATLARDDVDALYVATLHPMHEEPVRVALEAGIPVLCEKPMTMTAATSRVLFDLAHEHDTFLMEAVWMRFVPAVREAKRLIAEGRIGKPTRLCAEFIIDAPFDSPDFGAGHRLYAPELGGGALHDLGVYPIHAALHFLGRPDEVMGSWQAAPTGVDASADLRFSYDDGRQAYLTCGFGGQSDGSGANLCIVEGEDGSIVLDATFIGAERLWIVPNAIAPLFGFGKSGGATAAFRKLARSMSLPGIERIDLPYPDNGLQFETEAAGKAIREGSIEHPLAPHADTIAALEIIEEVLAQPSA